MHGEQRVAYAVAAWSGRRRNVGPLDEYRVAAQRVYERDRTVYLRLNLAGLEYYRAAIDEVYVVVAHDPDEPSAFAEYLESLTARGYYVIYRSNERLALGGLADAYRSARDDFDLWVQAKDDVAFVRPGFDRLLIDRLEACGADWVTSHIWGGFPRMEEGVMRASAMRRAEKRFGHPLPGLAPRHLRKNFRALKMKIVDMQPWRLVLPYEDRFTILGDGPPGVAAADYLVAAHEDEKLRRRLLDAGLPEEMLEVL